MESLTQPATILVIDDSEAIRVLVGTYLLEAGYRVEEAADGLTGLELCRRHHPDLVLLDVSMPGMDGFTLCSILQEEEGLRDIPVLILTIRGETETKTRAFDLGAVDYLTKPFSKREILARIRTHLKISSLTRSLQQANRELLAKQKELLEGIEAAAGLQRNLLPRRIPNCQTLRVASFFSPCQGIGGDIFNIQRLDEDHLALYILDVSGHGFPAAMMTALASQALSPSGNIVKSPASGTSDVIAAPAEVLHRLNREFPIERFNLYQTVAYLLLDTRSHRFRYSCGGHPPPVHLSRDNKVTLLDAGGPPVGLVEHGGNGIWLEGEGILAPGERIYLYTDGLVHAPNEAGEIFSQERFIDAICKSRDLDLHPSVQNIVGELKLFSRRVEPDDDITLLAVERVGEETTGPG